MDIAKVKYSFVKLHNILIIFCYFSLIKAITMNLLQDILFGVYHSLQEVWEVQGFEEQSISGTGQQSTDNLIIFIQTVVFYSLKFNKENKEIYFLLVWLMHLCLIAIDIFVLLFAIFELHILNC